MQTPDSAAGAPAPSSTLVLIVVGPVVVVFCRGRDVFDVTFLVCCGRREVVDVHFLVLCAPVLVRVVEAADRPLLDRPARPAVAVLARRLPFVFRRGVWAEIAVPG